MLGPKAEKKTRLEAPLATDHSATAGREDRPSSETIGRGLTNILFVSSLLSFLPFRLTALYYNVTSNAGSESRCSFHNQFLFYFFLFFLFSCFLIITKPATLTI